MSKTRNVRDGGGLTVLIYQTGLASMEAWLAQLFGLINFTDSFDGAVILGATDLILGKGGVVEIV